MKLERNQIYTGFYNNTPRTFRIKQEGSLNGVSCIYHAGKDHYSPDGIMSASINIREATMQEKAWLMACEIANELAEKPTWYTSIIKFFPYDGKEYHFKRRFSDEHLPIGTKIKPRYYGNTAAIMDWRYTQSDKATVYLEEVDETSNSTPKEKKMEEKKGLIWRLLLGTLSKSWWWSKKSVGATLVMVANTILAGLILAGAHLDMTRDFGTFQNYESDQITMEDGRVLTFNGLDWTDQDDAFINNSREIEFLNRLRAIHQYQENNPEKEVSLRDEHKSLTYYTIPHFNWDRYVSR